MLVVAGDVADTLRAARLCLATFRRKFRRVFYTPGNHDLWIRPRTAITDEPSQFPDSVAKFVAILQLCDELGCETTPAQVVAGLYVVPLHSWYDAALDEHDPRPGAVRFDKHCRWPVDDEAVSQVFAQLCRRRVRDANYLPAPGGARERGRGGAARAPAQHHHALAFPAAARAAVPRAHPRVRQVHRLSGDRGARARARRAAARAWAHAH